MGCKFPECTVKNPSYGQPGTKKGEYCKPHAPNGYENVKSKRCIYDGCKMHPSFGKPNTTKPEYCKPHAPKNYINVKDKKCLFKGCDKPATFRKLNTRKSEFCKTHAPKNYINFTRKRCIYPGCTITNPAFGRIGTKKREYCKKHIPEPRNLYENVVSKRCIYPGCRSIGPVYGRIGTRYGEYCKTHIPDPTLFEDVTSKRCKHEKCKIYPLFAKAGSTTGGEYCKTHAPSDYVDVINRKCIYPGCKIKASFAKIGSKTTEYCSTHIPCQSLYEDVVNRKCDFPGCKTGCIYGIPGNSPNHCAVHKEANDIRFPKSICKHEGCNYIALFGFSKPAHCEKHAEPDEIDLVQRNCKSCGLPNIVDKNGNCGSCDPENMFRVMCAKQKRVKAFLDSNEFDYISYDRMIDKGSCGKERPDFLFDCVSYRICLEVDEHQHGDKDNECERIRMINISQTNGIPTLFIRWNPDKYKPLEGHAEKDSNIRLDALKKELLYWGAPMKNKENDIKYLPTEGFCFCVYMYYNFDDVNKWKELEIIF
jgi:hypothetical protein